MSEQIAGKIFRFVCGTMFFGIIGLMTQRAWREHHVMRIPLVALAAVACLIYDARLKELAKETDD